MRFSTQDQITFHVSCSTSPDFFDCEKLSLKMEPCAHIPLFTHLIISLLMTRVSSLDGTFFQNEMNRLEIFLIDFWAININEKNNK